MGIIDGFVNGVKKIEQGVVKIVNKIKKGIKFLSSTIRYDCRFADFGVSSCTSCFSNGKNFRTCIRKMA